MTTRPSGADVLTKGDVERMTILRDVYLARAKEARRDISSFIDFVIREEFTRKPLKTAPHQKLFLDFILQHERSVVMLPIGHSKTSSSAALTLRFLGEEPTSRGAVVSATQGQAEKVVRMVRDYIEQPSELQLVYPRLMKSRRQGDPWTQTLLTIDRPPGIRDASLMAVGIDGKIEGSRLSWIIIDDILTRENTNTKEARDKVNDWIDSSVLSRLDPHGGRIVVLNTAWHRDDLLHRLMARGWATMRMDVEGGVFLQDDSERLFLGDQPFDHPLIVPDERKQHPSAPQGKSWFYGRLDNFKGKPDNEQTLWPARMNKKQIAIKKREYIANPNRFFQLYMNQCRDDASAKCKVEWIEACKLKARELGFKKLPRQRIEGVAMFTGVDLAFGIGKHNDLTALFTMGVLPSKLRLIVDIEFGQWDGPTVEQKIIAAHRRYGSVIRVENNAAQKLMEQSVHRIDPTIPIKGHTTNAKNKYDPIIGVEAVFSEIANAAWLIPSDEFGRCEEEVQFFIDACYEYQADKHVNDLLMACTFSRHQAFEWGLLSNLDADEVNKAADMIANLASSH